MIQILQWASAHPIPTLMIGVPVVIASKALSKGVVSYVEPGIRKCARLEFGIRKPGKWQAACRL